MEDLVERITIHATPVETLRALERLLDASHGGDGGAPQISLPVSAPLQDGVVPHHDVLMTFMRSFSDVPAHERIDVIWEATTGGPMPFPGFAGTMHLGADGLATSLTISGRVLDPPDATGTPAGPHVMLRLARAAARTLADTLRDAVENGAATIAAS